MAYAISVDRMGMPKGCGMMDKQKEIFDKDLETALTTGITMVTCSVCGTHGLRVLEDGKYKIKCQCGAKPILLPRKPFKITIQCHTEQQNFAPFTSTSNVNGQEIISHHMNIDALMEGIRRDLMIAYPQLQIQKYEWVFENEKVAKRRGC